MARVNFSSPRVLMAFVIAGFSLVIFLSRGPAPVYCKLPFEDRQHAVVMFGTEWCSYCKNARNFFVDNEIKYCEYNVDSSDANSDAFRQLGGSGVPLIVVGDNTLHGYNRRELVHALRKEGLMN